MASTPILNKMIADIERMGGDEYFHDQIANGKVVRELALPLGVSRNFLSSYLNRTPELKQKMVEARIRRADFLAEEILQIADDVKADPNEINKAKNKIDVRKWIANIDNPEKYGLKQQGGVQINIGNLHLDALRQVQDDLKLAHGDVVEGDAIEVDEEDQ